MIMKFVDRDGNIIHCEDRPSNVLVTHKAMSFKALHNWIMEEMARCLEAYFIFGFIFETSKNGE